MRALLVTFLVCLVVGLLTGCEWTGGAGVQSWDSSSDWVDFSGSYKAADGGVVVTAFGYTNGGTTATSTNTVTGEHLGTGDGSATAFSGILAHSCIRGSLTIEVGSSYQFTDTAGTTAGTVSLNVTPSDGSSGTINYDTALWSLSFPAPIASGTKILASYTYLSTTTTNGAVAQKGNHGTAIYSFIVYQTGNKLQIIDSNGSTYEGTIGSVRTTGGQTTDQTGAIPTSGPVEAQFSATGVSQGYTVTIVGVLQGTLSGSSFTSRTMKATFMETGGYEADIDAAAQ